MTEISPTIDNSTDADITAAKATDYDVAIIGGGMAGASLACHLAQASGDQLRIVLIERFAFPVGDQQQAPLYQPSFDARSTALSYGSRKIYQQMGIWPLLSEHLTAIQSIHVSDKGHWGSVVMTGDDLANDIDELGYVVENHWLGRVLMHRMQQFDNIQILAPAEVESIKAQDQQVTIALQQQPAVTAALTVIADGVDSALARQLGIETTVTEYGQCALIANVSFRKHHHGRAYERFTGTGPMALLPLSTSEQGDPRAALVWSLPPDLAETYQALPEADFLAELQQQFGYRQGRFVRCGERHLYPLKLTMANEQARHRVVVLGNAAHTLHPVAGQGYNLVLRDVAALSERLLTDWQVGQPLSASLPELLDYHQQQQADQQQTATFSDVLPRLFSTRSLAVEAGRGAGLVMMDLLPPMKQRFIRFAAGLAGREADASRSVSG